MSNLEPAPAEVMCSASAAVGARPQVLEPRLVPLGGVRAMTVRRTLPQRARSLIGAWCFCDHYGPDDVAVSGGMDVPPHPHTGLQTVSWLFEGAIDHRDSIGSAVRVRPGQLQLMTAGRGIAHSEVSTPDTTRLHGVQLWVALPDGARDAAPAFESHTELPVVETAGARIRVFMGELAGAVSPARCFTPLVGAELTLDPGADLELPVEAAFEHGVLVDAGPVLVDGEVVEADRMAYLSPGHEGISLRAGDGPARLVLLGGEPFAEDIVMWWNFVGRSHEEVVAARAAWMAELGSGFAGAGRFGRVPGYPGGALPAPVPPNVRLRPRERR